ncbi:L-type lectin-domain containing receptor kinase VIII.2-like [Miscanthus floridulus]|uniref:L-type lectin-domain containing receptor kinase VIII.2-like n=1 Tax=Miscanthus floridulus TaxID=154761 RepID=UPI003459FBC6
MFLLAWQCHELASQPDAAVGVHGADPAHVPTRIIEAAEELGAEEPDLDAELVQPQVALPRRVPEPAFTDLHVAGTCGFIAPAYSVGHRASRETDVFAFGALVLEVVTGQLALRAGDPRCPLLSDWVWQMHGRGALLSAVDQSLGADEFDHDEAGRLLLLALACSSPNPGDRPIMP